MAAEQLYSWHNGITWQRGDRPLYLFPRFWQFLPLQRVPEEAPFARSWCREQAGVDGLPFAIDGGGAFLVAESGDEGFVWEACSDYVEPCEEGSLADLIEVTCQALRGVHREYRAEFLERGMDWGEIG
ncbi:hypothetical protein [Kribbella sp. NPDC051770]|uniref:hypothetical protein n=1 Tax=Kribbella sp. NPDC051770 TaxID=3155413 RepID=UPI00342F7625